MLTTCCFRLELKKRRLLFTLAYQLTGSASDAEDVVQDVFLKINDVDLARLVEPKAYLCKMVTNRCRDLFKSARKRRELYFGQWLPEPILIPNDESFDAVVRDELLSYAMLVLLERLSHAERAVFVLREALGFEYSEGPLRSGERRVGPSIPEGSRTGKRGHGCIHKN